MMADDGNNIRSNVRHHSHDNVGQLGGGEDTDVTRRDAAQDDDGEELDEDEDADAHWPASDQRSSAAAAGEATDAAALTSAQAARVLRFELEDLLGSSLTGRSRSWGAAVAVGAAGTIPRDEDYVDEEDQLHADLTGLLGRHHSDVVLQALLMTAVEDPCHPNYTGRYPLHLACDVVGSPRIVAALLQHERTVTKGTRRTRRSSSSSSSSCSVRTKDRWGDLPLHTACSRGVPYVPVVRMLLDHDDDDYDIDDSDNDIDATASTVGGTISGFRRHHHRRRRRRGTLWAARADGSLPIHTACRYDAPPQVLRMLLEDDDGDDDGNGDDHSNGQKTTSLLLLARDNTTYGQLPIHVACRCRLNVASLRVLLEHDVHRRTVLMRDSAGRLPIHVAYLHNPKAHRCEVERTVLRLLLEATVAGRIGRVGLARWKSVTAMLVRVLEESSRKSEERDEMTREKLDWTRAAVQELLLERAVLLELALWKATCCHRYQQQYRQHQQSGQSDEPAPQKTANEFNSAIDRAATPAPTPSSTAPAPAAAPADPAGAGHTNDDDDDGVAAATTTAARPPLPPLMSMRDVPEDLKRQCRITSGAEMIIPAILSYVEDEPVAKLMEQFRRQ